MFVLMLIGLFTSRIVLQTLGVEDYGVYNAVGGVVTFFTFISNAVSSAISRFLAFELGKNGDSRAEGLRRVFCSAIIIQLFLIVLIVILTETVGLWFLHHEMSIPEGRMGAAEWVLQCSLGVLIFSLLSVPFNATIIAHEQMSAFAFISIFEGILKLAVALCLLLAGFDKLKAYAVLMLLVSFLVRSAYGIYCKRHFPESRGKFVYDASLLKKMSSFAGWNFFGSSAMVFNTQGVNLVVNVFFGVTVNAARGIAAQIENIVKQFVSNFLTALNPQITKTWAAGDKAYCFSLVRNGSKYSYLVILAFFIPFYLEAEALIGLWLGQVPEWSALFVRLTLIGLLADMFVNSQLTLIQATGNVKAYYLVAGLGSYLGLPLVWLLFKAGAPPQAAYFVFIGIYSLVCVVRLIFVHRLTGFPIGIFLKDVVLRLLVVTLLSCILPCLLHTVMPDGWLRVLLVCLASFAGVGVFGFLIAVGQQTRAAVIARIRRRI